jgi:hypothetical protein
MKKQSISLALAVILVVSMFVPAFAADKTAVETKSYKISSDYNGDKQADFSWTLPGVTSVEKMTMGNEKELATENPNLKPLVDKQVNVFTIKAGTKIDITGAFGVPNNILEYKNGKLCYKHFDENVKLDWNKIRKVEYKEERVDLPRGAWYTKAGKDSYISFLQEGYYIISMSPLVSQCYETDAKSADFLKAKPETAYKYGYAVIHVVKAEEK